MGCLWIEAYVLNLVLLVKDSLKRITLIGAMADFCSLLELVSFKGGLCKTPFGSSPIINKDEIELSLLKPQDNVRLT